MTSSPLPFPHASELGSVDVPGQSPWPVDMSIETAHETVAAVRLVGAKGWHLASWSEKTGRWHVSGGPARATVTEALERVSALVAIGFFDEISA
jgi:hypothetical protein